MESSGNLGVTRTCRSPAVGNNVLTSAPFPVVLLPSLTLRQGTADSMLQTCPGQRTLRSTRIF